uniref:Putative major epididymal secretory protein he1 n=2 Tax=Ixodes ricinus TaxID=34613 RepID=A0A090XCS2_IXORI
MRSRQSRRPTRTTDAMARHLLPGTLLLAALCGLTEAIKWTDCGSSAGQVTSVSVTGCEHSDTCIPKKGHRRLPHHRLHLERDEPDGSSEGLRRPGASSRIPFDCTPSRMPARAGYTCPVPARRQVPTYRGSFPIKPIYPSLSLEIKVGTLGRQGPVLGLRARFP